MIKKESFKWTTVPVTIGFPVDVPPGTIKRQAFGENHIAIVEAADGKLKPMICEFRDLRWQWRDLERREASAMLLSGLCITFKTYIEGARNSRGNQPLENWFDEEPKPQTEKRKRNFFPKAKKTKEQK